jgi:hypothetical protein
MLCAVLVLLPATTEFGFLIASVVCRASPNISDNELEVAHLEALGHQHQMSGPSMCPSEGKFPEVTHPTDTVERLY